MAGADAAEVRPTLAASRLHQYLRVQLPPAALGTLPPWQTRWPPLPPPRVPLSGLSPDAVSACGVQPVSAPCSPPRTGCWTQGPQAGSPQEHWAGAGRLPAVPEHCAGEHGEEGREGAAEGEASARPPPMVCLHRNPGGFRRLWAPGRAAPLLWAGWAGRTLRGRQAQRLRLSPWAQPGEVHF